MNSKEIENFLKFLREAEEKFNMAQEEEIELNNQTQDILHFLELEKHPYHEYAKLAKKLKTVREERRKVKDYIQETGPIMTWLENNRQTIKNLEQLLGTVRKAEKSTVNRIYIPKSSIDVLKS